jgi:hypothetical protein
MLSSKSVAQNRLIRLALLAALGATAGCSTPAALPPGWVRAQVTDCCSVGLPKGGFLRKLPNAIDQEIFKVEEVPFVATIAPSTMTAGPPIATPAKIVSTREVRVGNLRAFSTSYHEDGTPESTQVRQIAWVLASPAPDGVISVVLNATCSGSSCKLVDAMIPTFVDSR